MRELICRGEKQQAAENRPVRELICRGEKQQAAENRPVVFTPDHRLHE